MQQQLQQLEMQKLEAEIQLLQAQAAEAGAKSQVQGAKVAVEEARADNLASEASKKALDFSETMDGTKHMRELEKEVQKGKNNLVNTNASKAADLEREFTMGTMNALTNMGKPQ